MSGHSKWSTIKRAKGAADAKRGQQFSKLSRAITMAAKQGGTDPDGNIRLKAAIEAARAASMPKENITRAIEKVNDSGSKALEEVTYEGYGPGGSAILIEAVTDNRNRTVAEFRSMLTKAGGSLSESGSVAWMFSLQAIVTLAINPERADDASMAAIEAGASDLEFDNQQGILTVVCDPSSISSVQAALEPYGSAEVDQQLIASTNVTLEAGPEKTLLNLLEVLDDHDDVQRVSTNALLQSE